MKSSICRYDVSMRRLLEAINGDPAGIAFIVDDNEKLCGVITDGDFRRMLLAGRSLDESISKTDLKPFVVAAQGESVKDLLKKTDKRVRVVPIVDKNGKPVDYFRYEHKVHFTPVASPDLKGNEFTYLCDAFLSTWISSAGSYITRFENEFAAYCQSKHGVAVSNGTVALHLALLALGVGAGDEVIVPDLTFAATINTVLHAGATPVIVDVDKDSWCIDPAQIEKAITSKTKAIVPVHVYGQPCDMDAIMEIARKHKLFVIEDAAEAHGATYKGKKVGSMGDISCFSFYGNKIITTGEGGMCLTNSNELNERMRVLRDHGMNKSKRYWHDMVGYNYRMTNLQAAIGCGQLERIGEIIEKRKSIESGYKKALADNKSISWQQDIRDCKRVTWLVCALSEEKEVIMNKLKENQIDVRPFFYPLSAMDIYKKYARPCPVTASLSAKGFNLPTVEEVDFERVKHVLM
ncbi:MAG: aminotransferase class I/II-fold pyridoxal phosphate-dependent enzyme [Flavobacteriales bacterium]